MSAQEIIAGEYCEVINPDGIVVLVKCCEITQGESNLDEECGAVKAALDSVETRVLESAIAQSNRNRLARYLRTNPGVSLGSFTIERPAQQLVLLCCTCVPGKTCTEDGACILADDGKCFEGELRVICSGDAGTDDEECTSID